MIFLAPFVFTELRCLRRIDPVEPDTLAVDFDGVSINHRCTTNDGVTRWSQPVADLWQNFVKIKVAYRNGDKRSGNNKPVKLTD